MSTHSESDQMRTQSNCDFHMSKSQIHTSNDLYDSIGKLISTSVNQISITRFQINFQNRNQFNHQTKTMPVQCELFHLIKVKFDFDSKFIRSQIAFDFQIYKSKLIHRNLTLTPITHHISILESLDSN